ncbi:hypothetical protein HPB51_006868 [Rhipicephalus microplus]|uniref:Uncharacterized protein n=1 Tax=Rhipicephalus microplus TaxID=6941 RepID=A0A9J6E875_RHIMP|nr:hypothetical protein HPB51_006868 [Rhipicephalus microplus]
MRKRVLVATTVKLGDKPPSLAVPTPEDHRSPAATPDFPLPPKKFPKSHAGSAGTTTATADEGAHPWRRSGAELTEDASATSSEQRPRRPGVVHFAPVAPTVVLLPLSPEGASSPRKKSATLGNFLDTHETSWKFTPGHRGVTSTGATAGDQAMAPGMPRKDSKEELMTSSSDTDDFEELPPPPQTECGTEDSTDSNENIYESSRTVAHTDRGSTVADRWPAVPANKRGDPVTCATTQDQEVCPFSTGGTNCPFGCVQSKK